MNHHIRLVLRQYPQAVARHYPPTFEMGRLEPTRPGGWIVYPAGGFQEPIGQGPTQEAAWADAVRRLLAA